jgi:hypothetical protein
MNHAEQILLEHLVVTESLDVLSDEGFHQNVGLAVIPTELIRKITKWSLDSYWESGRKVAPSREAVLEVWGDRMEALEIAFGDPTEEIDSIGWVVQTLRAQYATSESHKLVRQIAAAVAKADPTHKIAAVVQGARDFHLLSQSLSSRRQESELGPGFEDALLRHEDRRTNGHLMRGLALGLDLIDQHTLGIHPGELAVFAMTSGGGKSWIAAHTLLSAWRSGKKALLVTLENDLDMTFDRMVCMLARVDYTKWQRGEADEGDLQRVFEHTDLINSTDHKPVITMLQPGERDPLSIVRRAHTLGCEALIVDQLTHVEEVPGTRARERHQVVAQIMREFHTQIRDDAVGMLPLLLLHQINRDGRQAARKTGRYEYEHLGLSTEVENVASHVWAAYQSDDHKSLEMAVWQSLKFRRGIPLDWEMRWRLGIGDIRALRVYEEQDA